MFPGYFTLPALVKLEAQPKQLQFKCNPSIQKSLGHEHRDRWNPRGRAGSGGLGELETTGICCTCLGYCSLSRCPSWILPAPLPVTQTRHHCVYAEKREMVEVQGSEQKTVAWLYCRRKQACRASHKQTLGLINVIIPSKDLCAFKYILHVICCVYGEKFCINSV